MPLSSLTNPAAYHLLSYGTLLGTSIFQSFIGGIISFQVLPRPQFSQLQQKLFPVYFCMQTILPLALVITYPSNGHLSGFRAVTYKNNYSTLLVPLATMTLCGLANWVVIGPMTTKTMRERKHQETRDGKKYYDAGPKSDKMQSLNKRFSMLHGISSLVNLIEILVTIWYGFTLAERL